jgi:hypothetical protein
MNIFVRSSMEKENIEAKDKEFRNKLKEMRMQLAKRQVRANQKEKNPRNHTRILIPVLLVFVVAIYSMNSLFDNFKEVTPNSNISFSDSEGEKVESHFEAYMETSSESEDEFRPKRQKSNAILSGEDLSLNSVDITETNDITEAQDINVHKSGFDLLPNGTRIVQNLVCSGVKARKCVVPQSDFTLTQKKNPHVWMEVYSDSVPYVLKHVYYHEGRKYVEVPLKIDYHRMRTWSYITVNDSDQLGSWHVEIVAENGKVLGRTDFKIKS